MRTKLKKVKKVVDDADKATKAALLQQVRYSWYLIIFQHLLTVSWQKIEGGL